ncbi:MAG: hypothetical protein AAGF07_04650 [Patescibacteria group bacterium]
MIKSVKKIAKKAIQKINPFTENPRYISWFPVLDYVPDKLDKNILELGLGQGTQHLLNNFKHVYSFEVFHTKYWYDYTVKQNESYKNWEHKFIYSTDLGISDVDAELVATKGVTRRTGVLKKYFELLEDFVDFKKLDVVFVDQGFHMRGECVNYFLDKKIPYVICDDWNFGEDDYYGYRGIKPNSSYFEKVYSGGMGDKVWILKS